MTPLLFLTTLSFAQDTTATPPAVSHIVTDIRGDTNSLVGTQNMAIVLWCQPAGDGELAKKIGYTSPNFQSESKAMIGSLTPRPDITALVVMNNPTASEVTDWLKHQAESLGGDKYREILVSVACPATGGDTDEERLFTREVMDPNTGGLAFADLAIGINAIANSTVWLLDASRNLSVATGIPTFGPTADDLAKLGVKDSFAISSSASGKYGDAGLLTSAAHVIAQSKGGALSLDTLYYTGIKAQTTMLDLGTSLGTPGDGWTDNQQRVILPGGSLLIPITEMKMPIKRKSVPTGCWVAGGGALTLIAGSVFAIQASTYYDTLDMYNRVGGESQAELDATVDAYRLNTGLAIGFSSLGALATASGITWTVLDKNEKAGTIVPTGTGMMVTGSW